jgi:hypothetical protein
MSYRRRAHFQKAARNALLFRLCLGFLILAGLMIASAFALMGPVETERTTTNRSLWERALKLGERALHISSLRPEAPVIYPYSIIPGGIHNVEDLRRAIETDPVVAAQYANFDLARFRIIKSRRDEYAYVSFRMGNNVYWTKKRLKVAKGETLITDGAMFGRTRCGNRLSQSAQAPTWSKEPPPAVLDTPATAAAMPTAAFAVVLPDLSSTTPTDAPDGPLNQPLTLLAGITGFVPAPFIAPLSSVTHLSSVVPAANCSTNGGCRRPSRPESPPPPSPVPENSNLVLLSTGLAAFAIYRSLLDRASSTLPAGQNGE